MSELVRELFPNVPTQCQECPGIEKIAQNISNSLSFVRHVRETADHIRNGQRPDINNPVMFCAVVSTAGNIALWQLSGAEAVVEKLTRSCKDGNVEFDVRIPNDNRLFRKKPDTIEHVSLCGSIAPEALLTDSQDQIIEILDKRLFE